MIINNINKNRCLLKIYFMKSAIVIGSTGLVGGYLTSTPAKSKSFEKVIALVQALIRTL